MQVRKHILLIRPNSTNFYNDNFIGSMNAWKHRSVVRHLPYTYHCWQHGCRRLL